ncbi:MAG: hypothetical protein J6Q82_03920 [Clostridia bacterium]|nr:hypothetical protein [Clostridia bacterium]
MNFYELQEYFKSDKLGNVKKENPSYIRVMSSNVLTDADTKSSDPNSISPEERMDILCAMYLAYKPDFLGLQEVSYNLEPEILERLDSLYAIVPAKMGDYVYHRVDYQQNNTPLLYNKHLYELVDTRFHFFNVMGMWGYQWALYKSKKKPGKKYIHMNLHFYYQADERQLPGIEDTHYELVHLRRMYPNVPIFVTGDYNNYHTSEYFKILFDGLSMESGMVVAEVGDGLQLWNHAMGSMEPIHPDRTAIDHASITTDLVDVKLHRVLRDPELAKTSDHFPMFLDLKEK